MDRIPDIIARLKAVKIEKGYSNKEISELSGVPKGTVDRVFGATPYNYSYETLRPIISVLTDYETVPAPDETKPDDEITELLKTVIAEKNEQITDLKTTIADITVRDRKDNATQAEMFKDEIKRLRQEVKLHKILNAVLLGLIIAAWFVIDLTNGNFGFFRG